MNDTKRTFARKGRRPALRKAGAFGALETILTVCVYDTDLPNPDTEGGYTLNLKIVAGNLTARSFGHPDDKETKDESFINVADGDYAVFIFDNDDNFLQRVDAGWHRHSRLGRSDWYVSL